MIVIDTSALIAILFKEPEAEGFLRHILDAPAALLSCANYPEAMLVWQAKRGNEAVQHLNDFIAAANIQLIAVSPDHARTAHLAFSNYGKVNHPAGPNFGDCFAYALAKTTEAKLLFKGEDFRKGKTSARRTWRWFQRRISSP